MAEQGLEREAVQNPFDMGPNTNFQQPARQMKQQINKPRDAFHSSQNGMMIVDILQNFASTGGKMYEIHANKKIAEDKVVQTALADNYLAPTDDATVAGIRAHAAVMMQDQVMKHQLELSELAKTGISRKAWGEKVREKYQESTKYLQENYNSYDKDPEMQQLLPLAFREMMPGLNAARESENLRIITEKGMNSTTDYIVNQAALIKQSGVKIEPGRLAESFTAKLKALKLTSDQKDQVLENAILTSKSPDLIEAAKVWNGDRKSSLFNRSAKLQTLEKQLVNEAISSQAVALSTKLSGLKQAAITGQMRIEDVMSIFDKMNKDTNGEAVSGGFVSSVWSDYYHARNAEAELTRDKQDLGAILIGDKAVMGNPNVTDTMEIPEKRQRAALRSMYEDAMTKVDRELEGVPEAQKATKRAELVKREQSRISDLAVIKNTVVEPFVNSLHNLATSNVSFRATKDESGQPVLGNTEREGIALIDAMSSTALIQHLDALGAGGKEARVIRDFLAYRERGIVDPQALTQAQANFRNTPIASANSIKAGLDGVLDKFESLWMSDIDEKQKPYITDWIRSQVALSNEPDSKANIKLVTETFKSRWTKAGDIWVNGSPAYIAKQLGCEGDLKGRASGKNEWMEFMLNSYVWSETDNWKPLLGNNGLKESDVFPEVDPRKGTIRVVGRSSAFNANIYLTPPVPLSSIRKLAAKKKEYDHKLAAEKLKKGIEDYEKSRAGIQSIGKEY